MIPPSRNKANVNPGAEAAPVKKVMEESGDRVIARDRLIGKGKGVNAVSTS
jgi:hypothetical protein